MWQNIYNHSQHKTITLYYVNRHQPLRYPVNIEVDELAHIQWLEETPAEDSHLVTMEDEAHRPTYYELDHAPWSGPTI